MQIMLSDFNDDLTKVTIYLLTSCYTEERIAQNIYIHNSNRNYFYNIIFIWIMNIIILRYSLFGIAEGQEVDRNFS